MYFRFNLSFRDVEELMIERGVDVSYETIRRWVDKFGSTYAKWIKSRSESPSPVWHLDEVYTKINGKMVYFGGQSMTKELFSMLLSKDDEIRKLQHDYSGNF